MANTSIFPRLQRLFSTDVIIRNVGGNDLKIIDINKIQQSGKVETNSLVDRYNRMYTNSPSSMYGTQKSFTYQTLRTQLYSEYDVMDQDAIIASALDIIADEATLKNNMGEVLQIRSSNEDIQKILYNLFYDVLNIEFNLWSWIRQMCKYGDFFLKLEIADKYGVYNIIPYTAYHMERIEGFDPKNPAAVKFVFNPEGVNSGYYSYPNPSSFDNKNLISFENYEIAHFRLLSEVTYLPYGRSYLEPARKLFKQYALMEDAMLIHRITRAPEKRIFYINIGGIPPNEVENFMQQTISKMKRTPYVDQQTGEYNLKYNMQNMTEDFFIPIRGNDTTTKIETTKGLDYDGITDVNYLKDKLFAALKIPKAFLGYEADIEGKATLATEDIRFARTVERIQRIITSELYKIALIHLYTQGYNGDDLVNFEISLTTPSIIYEQEKIALLKEKIDAANSLLENKLLPTDWIYDNIFHFSEDQFDEYRDMIREDAKRAFRLTQIENEGNDPLESGQSYGTPHDLAFLYGKGRYNNLTSKDVPPGYDENELGRPKEKVSNINTQDNPLGKDRLGKDALKADMNNRVQNNLSEIEYLKNSSMLKSLKSKNPKKMILEEEEEIKFMDESKINE